MARKYFICRHCGVEFCGKQHGHQYKYCSRACFFDARYGEVISDVISDVRNPLCLEAIRLCQSGLNKSDAAKRAGITYNTLTQWFRKYGTSHTAEIYACRTCNYCGKSLYGMTYLSNRRYCSRECNKKAVYTRRHPQSERKRAKSDPILRTKALELYWGGLAQNTIAQHLNIPAGTVNYWVCRFGSQRPRVKKSKVTRLRRPNQRLQHAETITEWLKALRELVPENPLNATSVHLVSKIMHGSGTVNQLVTLISDNLKQDPLSGELFAFCSRRYTVITTIVWKGNMFRIQKLPKQYGSYIWPHENFGLSVQVTENEFEYIISYQKTRGRLS